MLSRFILVKNNSPFWDGGTDYASWENMASVSKIVIPILINRKSFSFSNKTLRLFYTYSLLYGGCE